MTVGLGLCSDAILEFSYDFLFIALELSVLKPWLDRLAKNPIAQLLIAAPTQSVFLP